MTNGILLHVPVIENNWNQEMSHWPAAWFYITRKYLLYRCHKNVTHHSSSSVVVNIHLRMQVFGTFFGIQEFPGERVPEIHIVFTSTPAPLPRLTVHSGRAATGVQFAQCACAWNLSWHPCCWYGVSKCCLLVPCKKETTVVSYGICVWMKTMWVRIFSRCCEVYLDRVVWRTVMSVYKGLLIW